MDEALVARAQAGERPALEQLLGAVQTQVYALALRALGERAAAEDATQEILVRVARNLGQFRGEARFATWVYRVAANHLVDARLSRAEQRELSFDSLADTIDRGLAANDEPSRDPVLVRELMLSCTEGMLLCLDREHRLAFVLGELVELSGAEAAAVLDVDAVTYRKRLERARERLTEFLRARCGLVNSERPCRCERPAGFATAIGRPDASRWSWPGPLMDPRWSCAASSMPRRCSASCRPCADQTPWSRPSGALSMQRRTPDPRDPDLNHRCSKKARAPMLDRVRPERQGELLPV